MRAIPPDLSPAAVAAVDATLDGVVREHGVHIPLAVESGSRAWGFPSPDSDYDGRFVFVRPAMQQLTIWPLRDVIETPIVGELDVNGWELDKALRLLLKGNAVVVEQLQSRAAPTRRSGARSWPSPSDGRTGSASPATTCTSAGGSGGRGWAAASPRR